LCDRGGASSAEDLVSRAGVCSDSMSISLSIAKSSLELGLPLC
jgi:hypothetical protein